MKLPHADDAEFIPCRTRPHRRSRRWRERSQWARTLNQPSWQERRRHDTTGGDRRQPPARILQSRPAPRGGNSGPEGTTLEIAPIDEIPLYNGDDESEHGLPPAVVSLKEAIAGADGLLLVTPEYNNGIPGVFKNAIDWASRPSDDIARVFHGKPVAVIGATPGGFGTLLAQNGWLPVIRTLGLTPWFEDRLLASHARKIFDADGTLTDDATRERLRSFIAGFAEFAKRQSP